MLQGFAAGFVLLLGFAIPPLVALRRVPTLRVCAATSACPTRAGMAGYVIGVLALGGLILWESQDLRVGAWMLGGAVGTMLVSAAVVAGLMRAFAWTGTKAGFAWRFGLANLRRRPLGTITQVVALGVGIMALVLLTLVRGDLLASWKKNLPPDAPNRFVVSIQPDQVAPLQAFFAEQHLPSPEMYPMVRARLVALNGRPVSSADYQEERAKRLVDREFNLSWASRMQSDNRLVSGRWWGEAERAKPLFSVEDGIAQTLGIHLGDQLTYEIGGERLEGAVSSLRKVEWDSFHVNFFVVTQPERAGSLSDELRHELSSPARALGGTRHAGQALSQLRRDRRGRHPHADPTHHGSSGARRGVRVLVRPRAGLIVLFAAISATHDERMFDAAIMRTLGASSRQMMAAHAAEFAAIGALAGLLAAIGASALGWVLATRVLNVSYTFNPWIWLIGFSGGTIGVLVAGLAGTRRALSASPMSLFRESASSRATANA